MDKIQRFEKRIEEEQNHFKRVIMTFTLNKIKKESKKNEK